jgi:hypothetical protein
MRPSNSKYISSCTCFPRLSCCRSPGAFQKDCCATRPLRPSGSLSTEKGVLVKPTGTSRVRALKLARSHLPAFPICWAAVKEGVNCQERWLVLGLPGNEGRSCFNWPGSGQQFLPHSGASRTHCGAEQGQGAQLTTVRPDAASSSAEYPPSHLHQQAGSFPAFFQHCSPPVPLPR